MSALNESHVEDAALEWFGELGYAVGHGPRLAPGEAAADRNRSAAQMDEVNLCGEVILARRLREAIRRLNEAIPFPTLANRHDTFLPKLAGGS